MVDVEIEALPKQSTSITEQPSSNIRQQKPSKQTGTGKPSTSMKRKASAIESGTTDGQTEEGITICHSSPPKKAKRRKLSELAKRANNTDNVTPPVNNKVTDPSVQITETVSKEKNTATTKVIEEIGPVSLSQQMTSISSSMSHLPILNLDTAMTTPDRPESVSSGFQELSSCQSTPESSQRDTRMSIDSLLSTPESVSNTSMGHNTSFSRTGQRLSDSLDTSHVLEKGQKLVIQSPDNDVNSSQGCPPQDNKSSNLNTKCKKSLSNMCKTLDKQTEEGSSAKSRPKTETKSPAVKYVKLLDNKGRTILVPENLISQLQASGQKELSLNLSSSVKASAAPSSPLSNESTKATTSDALKLSKGTAVLPALVTNIKGNTQKVSV